jgi:hypothetical protein
MCELDRFLISRYNDGQRPEVRNSSKCQVVDVIWWFAVANVRLFVFGCTVPFTKRNSFYAPARVKQTSRANRFPTRALVRDRRYPDRYTPSNHRHLRRLSKYFNHGLPVFYSLLVRVDGRSPVN